MVKKKGDQVQFMEKRIFIISNRWPQNWYKAWSDEPETWRAFLRRVDHWIYIDSDREICRLASYEEFKETADNDGYSTVIKHPEHVNID